MNTDFRIFHNSDSFVHLYQILTTILSKKIYPQCSSPKATTPKKYLENKQFFMTDSDSEDDMSQDTNDGSKWVKTDSECKFCLFSVSHHSYDNSNKLFYNRLNNQFLLMQLLF